MTHFIPPFDRYRKKRERRSFRKRIRYSCRKNLADNRLRIKGRFVRADSQEALDYIKEHGSLDGARVGNQLKAKQEAQALKDAQALEALQALSSSMGAMRGGEAGMEEGMEGGAAGGMNGGFAGEFGGGQYAKASAGDLAGMDLMLEPPLKRERAYTVG